MWYRWRGENIRLGGVMMTLCTITTPTRGEWWATTQTLAARPQIVHPATTIRVAFPPLSAMYIRGYSSIIGFGWVLNIYGSMSL